jgi:DNA-directed RNA polymerase subunit omega
MARITVEDCLTRENNRFALVLLAAKRTKQILRGSKITIEDKRDNKSVVMALREIAKGDVRFKSEEDLEQERQKALLEREQAEQAQAAREIHISAASDIFKSPAEVAAESAAAEQAPEEPVVQTSVVEEEPADVSVDVAAEAPAEAGAPVEAAATEESAEGSTEGSSEEESDATKTEAANP